MNKKSIPRLIEKIRQHIYWFQQSHTDEQIINFYLTRALKKSAILGFEKDLLTGLDTIPSFKKDFRHFFEKKNVFYVINIVDMKKICDTQGLPYGDSILQEFGKIFIEQCSNSKIYRITGDRFFMKDKFCINLPQILTNKVEVIQMENKKTFDDNEFQHFHYKTILNLIIDASRRNKNRYFKVKSRAVL
ncbi:hypothetical protein OAA91_01695 [Fibrobacterales bacterium]|nr:hypothetical protein [Fibrobacterales bacterium]